MTIKIYNLEERTFLFAQKIKEFVKQLPKTSANFVYIPQLLRSSGSVAANYSERLNLINESVQLMKIFGSLICKNLSKKTENLELQN